MSCNETVVLVHGLGGSRLDMWPIARRLRRKGFSVRNWSYRSVGKRIETHAERLGAELSALDESCSAARFHLVTHSMGGIIARTMFESYRFDKLGRVIMLAPPHRGSHAARKIAPYLGWLTPSLAQLSDAVDSFVNTLPNSLHQNEIDFGIVEASKDRVIASGGVFLEGHRDFARVDGHHGILTWYPRTIELVENFLTHGTFDVNALTDDASELASEQSFGLERGT